MKLTTDYCPNCPKNEALDLKKEHDIYCNNCRSSFKALLYIDISTSIQNTPPQDSSKKHIKEFFPDSFTLDLTNQDLHTPEKNNILNFPISSQKSLEYTKINRHKSRVNVFFLGGILGIFSIACLFAFRMEIINTFPLLQTPFEYIFMFFSTP